jgi:dTMP kinase
VKTTPSKTRRRGLFVTFEGIEGSGKSTQCMRLAKTLREHGYRVVETREPGGTALAEQIRDLLLHPRVAEPISPETEACLILAARAQHVAQVIEPALRNGAVVVCDRFADSTLAYQGFARGLALANLRALNALATRGLRPSLTLLFDLPVSIGLARRRREGEPQNRLDREATRFHERVRKGFLSLARREPRRIKILDGRREPDVLAREIEAIVLKALSGATRSR